ncbi:acyl-CoA dehydrogenase family protein [Enemella dayhoffiae]|uniref:acyl-CoA dehydrogenase family protein n=1 Tax=Enemella dayhoffiae TaxID=2016507 RepID=UPI001E533422|nr:acyl-CoA dehydrogenase family protein [Enemella dayhoffiae]
MGSDAAAIRTRATRDGDDWIINGEKTFITGGNDADFVMVFAVTDPEKHKEGRVGESVTCFIVDRDQGWRSEYIDTMGQWGPAASSAVLGEVGKGFALALEWIG